MGSGASSVLSTSTLETDQLPFCCIGEWLSISCVSLRFRSCCRLSSGLSLTNSLCCCCCCCCRRAALSQTWLEHEHLHTQLQSSEWQGVVLRGPVLHSFGTVNLFHWSAFRADSSPAPPQSARNTHCRGDKGASLIGHRKPIVQPGKYRKQLTRHQNNNASSLPIIKASELAHCLQRQSVKSSSSIIYAF